MAPFSVDLFIYLLNRVVSGLSVTYFRPRFQSFCQAPIRLLASSLHLQQVSGRGVTAAVKKALGYFLYRRPHCHGQDTGVGCLSNRLLCQVAAAWIPGTFPSRISHCGEIIVIHFNCQWFWSCGWLVYYKQVNETIYHLAYIIAIHRNKFNLNTCILICHIAKDSCECKALWVTSELLLLWFSCAL